MISDESAKRVRLTTRKLTDEELALIDAVKTKGAEFLDLLETLRTPIEVVSTEHGDKVLGAIGYFEADIVRAGEKIEDAVMLAVKHITA